MRILLLGASGFVGGVLWSHLSRRHEVVGTCSSRDVAGLVRLDLRDHEALAGLAGGPFDLVIHAAGLVDLVSAEAAPELAWAVNVDPVEVLLEALRGSKAKLIFLSSDNVFDGSRDTYTEQDPPSPINVYGETKLAAEERVLRDPRHLVVRIPIVFGRSPWSDKFLARMAGATTLAQVDVVCAPLYLPSLASALEQLWDEAGVVHYGGAEVVTRFELMSRVQAALGLVTQVVGVRNDEAFFGPRRPKRLVLRSVRHHLQGPDLDTALRHMAAGR
jgi:dTDP-4-dehydrorhamnose reductase